MQGMRAKHYICIRQKMMYVYKERGNDCIIPDKACVVSYTQHPLKQSPFKVVNKLQIWF